MKYTILPGIVRTEVCGETMLVACGSARGKAPYARTLNETAAFLWKQLELWARRSSNNCRAEGRIRHR